MAYTVREQILSAFFDALYAIRGSVYDLKVERNRDTEVTHFPTLVVADGPAARERSNVSDAARRPAASS